MDKEQFVVRTDGGVRIGTSGMIDGKVVLGSLTPQSPPEPQGFIFLSKSKYFYVVIR